MDLPLRPGPGFHSLSPGFLYSPPSIHSGLPPTRSPKCGQSDLLKTTLILSLLYVESCLDSPTRASLASILGTRVSASPLSLSVLQPHATLPPGFRESPGTCPQASLLLEGPLPCLWTPVICSIVMQIEPQERLAHGPGPSPWSMRHCGHDYVITISPLLHYTFLDSAHLLCSANTSHTCTGASA